MSEQNAAGVRPVAEPSAQGPGPARRDDWRATRLDAELSAARAEARDAVGAALSTASAPDPASVTAWAAAELAVQACLHIALDRLVVPVDKGNCRAATSLARQSQPQNRPMIRRALGRAPRGCARVQNS